MVSGVDMLLLRAVAVLGSRSSDFPLRRSNSQQAPMSSSRPVSICKALIAAIALQLCACQDDPHRELLATIEDGDTVELRRLVDQLHDIDASVRIVRTRKMPDGVFATQEYRATLLHFAVYAGQSDAVAVLLDNEASLDAVAHPNGASPLIWAAVDGKVKIAKLLIDHGANIHIATDEEVTALHFAALQGHTSMVRLLLGEGADVNAQEHRQWTALHFSAQEGHAALIEPLIDAGADLEAREDSGSTPLIIAALYGGASVVQALIAAGAEVNASTNAGQTGLHFAAQNGDRAVAERLCNSGANVNATDVTGRTPLDLALYHRHGAVAKLLRRHDAP